MGSPATNTSTEAIRIRQFTPDDAAAVKHLFEVGRLAGQVMPNDTAIDIEQIAETYLADDGSNFWVAQYGGKIVGMVGVVREDEHLVEVRRLRVDPDHRGLGLSVKMMETALAFCRHHGYLKVILDTHMADDAESREMFDRFAFQHTRTRNVHGKKIEEYYLDLYRDPQKEKE